VERIRVICVPRTAAIAEPPAADAIASDAGRRISP
jgi:hypothetical protein